MRLSLEYLEPLKLSVFLVYKREEWEKLRQLYKNKGLEPYTTGNLFYQGITAHVYRYPSSQPSVFGSINTTIDGYDLTLIDDINRPFVTITGKTIILNYALFRVVPNCENEECHLSLTLSTDSMIPYNVMLQAVRVMLKEVKRYFSEGKLKWRVEVWTE